MPTTSGFWWALPNATPLNAGNPRTRVAPLHVFQKSNMSPIPIKVWKGGKTPPLRFIRRILLATWY
ncbi:hypothetical protein Cal7507_2840 [Calothrix sp. PCC 7507]|nr:hypothetical protein Cal7507_2840 [Calothrix sp. PCC 7507]